MLGKVSQHLDDQVVLLFHNFILKVIVTVLGHVIQMQVEHPLGLIHLFGVLLW